MSTSANITIIIIIIIIIITKNDEQDSVEVVQEVTVGQHNSIRLVMSGFQ